MPKASSFLASGALLQGSPGRAFLPAKGDDPAAAPQPGPHLEEASAAAPGDLAAAFAFSLTRLAYRPDDPRPLVLVLGAAWLHERGFPSVRGLGFVPCRLILVRTEREAQSLWALEEALKSGAVAGGLAAAETIPFVVTRRLEFAAREGKAAGLLLRSRPSQELSAARLRWRVSTLPSTPGADALSPGLPRWRAELTRRRDGPPGVFIAERRESDETHRLRLADRLADHGLVEDGRAIAAA